MSFIIHYIVQAGARTVHFDYVTDEPPTRKNLDTLQCALARDATAKMSALPYQQKVEITDDDVVIANIIPIPSGAPAATPIGHS